MNNFTPAPEAIATLFFFIFCVLTGFSQTDTSSQAGKNSLNPVQFNVGADLVSRYIWRGKDYGNSPAIQPNVSFSYAGLRIGVWGSYGVLYNETSGNYAEFDPNISYTLKWFTIGVTDYFYPNGFSPNNDLKFDRYFIYANDKTGHIFEASLTFTGPENVPLQVYAGTMFYGADKGKADGEYGKGTSNNYSTYFEISYPFTIRGIGVKPFIGGIPYGSAIYGPTGGVVNAGLTISKSLKISREYELPVFGSIISNPQAQSVFMVFGVSL